MHIINSMEETLGEFLRRVRKQKMLTLRKVEEKTGISNAYLSQVENNKIAKPSPSFLHKLAKFYDVLYENLMKKAGYPVFSNKSNQIMLRTSHGLKEITEDEEEELLEYLRFIRMRRSKR